MQVVLSMSIVASMLSISAGLLRSPSSLTAASRFTGGVLTDLRSEEKVLVQRHASRLGSSRSRTTAAILAAEGQHDDPLNSSPLHSDLMPGSAQLMARLVEVISARTNMIRELRQKHGHEVIDTVTVEQLLGGLRGVKTMLWETSILDPNEGIRMRGLTLAELRAKMPSAARGPGFGEPVPEGVLWLLMTGDIPTAAQSAAITVELKARATMSPHVERMIRDFPKEMHPMTQLSSAILAMQVERLLALFVLLRMLHRTAMPGGHRSLRATTPASLCAALENTVPSLRRLRASLSKPT